MSQLTTKKPGRPKGTTIDSSNLYVPLSARIPQFMRDRLDVISLKKRQSRSESVLEAINDYCFKHENLLKN